MTSKMLEFYDRVRRTEDKIKRLILSGDPSVAHQPQPTEVIDTITGQPEKRIEAVYVCSLENFDRMVTPGAVCGALLRHAATLIADQTHRLATAAEVAAWKQAGIERKALVDAEDAKRQAKFHVMLPPEKTTK